MAKEKLACAQMELKELEDLASGTEDEGILGIVPPRDYIEAFLGSVFAVLLLTTVSILPGPVLIVLPAEIYLVDRIYDIVRGTKATQSEVRQAYWEQSVTRAPVYRPGSK